MSAANNGGPAFPAEQWLDTMDPSTRNPVGHLGMTLRDYLAAKAMVVLLPQMIVAKDSARLPTVAGAAYEVADAMLKAREAA